MLVGTGCGCGPSSDALKHTETNDRDALRHKRERQPENAAAFRHDFPLLVESLSERMWSVVCDTAYVKHDQLI